MSQSLFGVIGFGCICLALYCKIRESRIVLSVKEHLWMTTGTLTKLDFNAQPADEIEGMLRPRNAAALMMMEAEALDSQTQEMQKALRYNRLMVGSIVVGCILEGIQVIVEIVSNL
jgi:hypothetical protein